MTTVEAPVSALPLSSATPANNVDPVPIVANIYATVDEYASRLRVSRGTVFAWLRRGLPSLSVGRTRRIITERADRWLEAGGADTTRRSQRASRGRPSSTGRASRPKGAAVKDRVAG
jgi:excisionase family DNA binding protein